MDRTPDMADRPKLRLCYPPDEPRSAAPVATPPIRPAMTIRMGRPLRSNAAPPASSFAMPPRAADGMPPPVTTRPRNTSPSVSLRLQQPARSVESSVEKRPASARSGQPGPARLRAAESITLPEPPALNLRHDDPRWVLAVRTHQVMQGVIVRPSDRVDLIRIGRVLGLDPFASNLIIAIVQDRARRGMGPGDASQLLVMVPQGAAARRGRWRRTEPRADRTGSASPERLRRRLAAVGCIAVLAAEIALIMLVI